MGKVKRYHCYGLIGMRQADNGTWCAYADADKRYRELLEKLAELDKDYREESELHHKAIKRNVELEANLEQIGDLTEKWREEESKEKWAVKNGNRCADELEAAINGASLECLDQ